MRFAFALLASTILAAPTGPLAAQTAPARLTLPKANAEHPEEFTNVSSVRELSDGRILVTDPREAKLLALDFKDGSAKPIGRAGRGPNEYSMLTPLAPLGRDSSLLVDFMQRRWLVITGDAVAATIPTDAPGVEATKNAMLAGADTRGKVLITRRSEAPTGLSQTRSVDSLPLVLVDRASGRADTIARLRPMPMRHSVRKEGERVVESSTFVAGPMLGAEDATLFPDGWVAIARIEPFRIDWRAPTGAWTKGAPLPVARVRVDARERDAFRERNKGNYERPKGYTGPWMEPPKDADFPEFVPAFTGRPLVGPRGLAFIRRARSVDHGDASYFVVDRAGRLLGELRLAPKEEILGAGESHLYIGWKDEDDIQRIRRHPWPAR